jgi:hypothetical protein
MALSVSAPLTLCRMGLSGGRSYEDSVDCHPDDGWFDGLRQEDADLHGLQVAVASQDCRQQE